MAKHVSSSLLIAGTLGTSVGCGPGLPQCGTLAAPNPDYLLVGYTTVTGDLTKGPEVEVTATLDYKSKRGAFHSAAVQAPSECAGPTPTPEALKLCGLYLKEFESALRSAGFHVLPWDIVQQVERTQGSPYEAAKSLGADVVFVFNRAEVSEIKPTGDSAARVQFQYLHSNASGGVGAPLAPAADDPVRVALEGFVKAHAPDLAGVSAAPLAVGFSVDVTALLVTTPEPVPPISPAPGAPAPPAVPAPASSTGETIWFYRRAETRPMKVQEGRRFLFAGIPGRVAYAPIRPKGVTEPPGPEGTNAGTSADAEAVQTQELEIIRGAAADFAQRFARGEGS
jgi:hypothetical protein